MLPDSGCVAWLLRCMVKSPDRKGDDHGSAAACDVGPGRPRRTGTPLPHHPRRHHPHPLPDDLVARRGPPGPEVAQLTRCSPDTVRRVLKRYLGGGPDAVPHRPHLGQPPHDPPAWELELVRVADQDPTRLAWTVRCGRVGCWPTTWPGSPGIGRGSSRCGSRCTGPGLSASGPAGC